MRILVHIVILLIFLPLLHAEYLYKTTLVRAAPGKLSELIDLIKTRMEQYEKVGDAKPFWMRHSQGDHWDLLLLFPIESYSKYYSAERMGRRQKAANDSGLTEEAFRRTFSELVAWDEDLFVYGPPLEQVRKAFEGASFFHVEMFLELPGKHAELYKQREMENAYLKNINRPQNLIFTRDQGAVWDLFTIGFYRDIKHFSESADIPEEMEEKAARLAGFAGANKIGFYLRTLMAQHHDTLAVSIK